MAIANNQIETNENKNKEKELFISFFVSDK